MQHNQSLKHLELCLDRLEEMVGGYRHPGELTLDSESNQPTERLFIIEYIVPTNNYKITRTKDRKSITVAEKHEIYPTVEKLLET
jgi:hypothetical protein